MEPLSLAVRREAQLAVMCDAQGRDAVSVLLVRHSDSELVVVDGLTFRLTVSIHKDMPIQLFVNAMESYHAYQQTGEEWQEGDGGGCIVSHRAFEPNRHSIIYNKLKGMGRVAGSRKQSVPNNQWQLTLRNHRVLQHFIRAFQRPFRINGKHRIDVRVLQVAHDKRVQWFTPDDSATEYVLRQLPGLTDDNDTLNWRFPNAATLQPGGPWQLLHGLPSDTDDAVRRDPFAWGDLWRFSQQRPQRFSVCLSSFTSTQLQEAGVTCRYVSYANRIAVVCSDPRPALKPSHSKTLDEAVKTQQAVAKEESEYERRAREQFSVRTSKAKEPAPGRKRMTQCELTFCQS